MLTSLLAELFAHLCRMVLLRRCMVERADLLLGAFELLTILPLVAVRMVKLLDGSVRLVAQQSLRAMSEVCILSQMLAVLRHIVKDSRRPPEIPHVMRIQAILRIVRIRALWAPARFVLVHVKCETLHLFEEIVEVLVEARLSEEALYHMVVLLVLVFHPHVQSLDQLKVLPPEIDEA